MNVKCIWMFYLYYIPYIFTWSLSSCIQQVDVIVFATGYSYDFPFLPASIKKTSGHRIGLYKHVFPPTLEHPTLAVVGFIHALGAIMPQAEMQSRWVTRVFKGMPEGELLEISLCLASVMIVSHMTQWSVSGPVQLTFALWVHICFSAILWSLRIATQLIKSLYYIEACYFIHCSENSKPCS